MGSKEDSHRLIKNSDKELKIKSDLEKAFSDAKSVIDATVSDANTERENIISKADAGLRLI